MESSSEAAVRAQARREIEIQELNAKFAAVDTAGSKEFGGRWDQAKHDLSMLDDGAKIPKEILQVALETDEPARVLVELSRDLELADQLLEMPPIKRAIAMDRIALQTSANRPQSKMSPQGDYENGRGSRDDRPSDRDSDEEWNRKEEARERRMREQRRQGMR